MLETPPKSARAVACDYLGELAHVLSLVSSEALARVLDILLEARAAGRRVYVMGNGGSAATASHLICDLMKTAHVEGFRPLRVFDLTANTPVLTAWSNDTDYARVFAEQVAALVDAGDVVIAISASGNSANILAGLRAAARADARTIALVGFDGGLPRASLTR